jgi:hypothetical protein
MRAGGSDPGPSVADRRPVRPVGYPSAVAPTVTCRTCRASYKPSCHASTLETSASMATTTPTLRIGGAAPSAMYGRDSEVAPHGGSEEGRAGRSREWAVPGSVVRDNRRTSASGSLREERAYPSMANSCHGSAIPFNEWIPTSLKLKPAPATRSFTVRETTTLPGSARPMMRAAM